MQVPGLSGVVAIAAGYECSLALLADGSVRAWGANLVGQLGNGTNVASKVPVAVLATSGTSTLFGVKAIVAGSQHALALLTNSSVLAWGSGQSGQLGNGGTANSKLPVPVLGVGGTGTLSGVTAVAGGAEHSLAVLGGGTAVAWGLGHEERARQRRLEQLERAGCRLRPHRDHHAGGGRHARPGARRRWLDLGLGRQ